MLKMSFFFSCLLKNCNNYVRFRVHLSMKKLHFSGSAKHYIDLSIMLAQNDFPLSFGKNTCSFMVRL